jgi:ATP-dependent Zn protease
MSPDTPYPDHPPVAGEQPAPQHEHSDHGGLPEPGVLGTYEDTSDTRKPMAWWDRVKILILLIGLFWFFVWAAFSESPLISFQAALDDTLTAKGWLLLLIAAEAVRQIHYVLSEHSAGYHRFWRDAVFGRFERVTGRLDDWNRFRIARALKLLAFLAILSLVLAAIFDVTPLTALVELPARVWSILPFLLQLMLGLVVIIGQFAALFWFLSRGGVDTYFPDDIETRFGDVWGQDPVVARVKESMVFLEDPESIEEKGGYVPGGILLWGPPGTGKTLMAEAVAGETGKPFVFVDPGAFIQMFMGVGILKVKSLFRKLRKLAVRYGGVIVFFDEADSLGNRGSLTPGFPGQAGATPADAWSTQPGAGDHLRWLSPAGQQEVMRAALGTTPAEPDGPTRDRIIMGGMGGGGGMGTLQALLTELSGLKKPRGFLNRYARRALGMRPKPPPKYRILVMMATNMPQALDEALLRPGRLDRIYKVGYPSKAGRKRTYQGYFDKVEHDLTDADMEKLATITPYATGATIKDLVNEALISALREGHEVITWTDVLRAKQLKELGPPEDVDYIERERHAVAVHEACHAVAAYRVRKHLTIDLATIEKGGTYLGMVSSIKPEDQFTHWKSEYEADIVVSLASLAGERLFFGGDSSSGVSGDLDSATTLATMMEGYWGMGATVASHGVTHSIGVGGGGRPGGDEEHERKLVESDRLGQRIENHLGELLDRAHLLLEGDRAAVLAVAHALETTKTLSGEDVTAVIDGTEGPVIDGRRYQEPGVADALERYHELAVTAHHGHSGVAAPLPSLNGHVPSAATTADLAPTNLDTNLDSSFDQE